MAVRREDDPIAYAKYQQEDLISVGCKRIYGADPSRKFNNYGDALDALLPYHLFLDIDPEQADLAESADQMGKNLVMSRQHVARDEALRRAHKCIADVDAISTAVKRRLEDMQNNDKRRRVYEEYVVERWMADARRGQDEAVTRELADIARAKRSLEEEAAAARRPAGAAAAPGAAGRDPKQQGAQAPQQQQPAPGKTPAAAAQKAQGPAQPQAGQAAQQQSALKAQQAQAAYQQQIAQNAVNKVHTVQATGRVTRRSSLGDVPGNTVDI